MKKIIFFGIALLIISGISLLSAQNETVPLSVAAEQPAATQTGETEIIGRLVRMEGTVNFWSYSQNAWKPATLQMAIGAGAWLQTAKSARAIISFGKEAVITVSEDAVLEIKEASVKPDGITRVRTNLTRGKIWSLVEKLKNEQSRYEVETPTAIAGVRGTTFMVNVDPDGRSSRIGVVEGEVGVRSMGEKPAYVVLKENMAAVIVYNKEPQLEAMAARETAEWENWKQSIPFSEIGAIGGMAEMHAMQMEEASKLVRETGFLKKASQKADEDFQVFKAALLQYYKDTGSFPTKEQGGLKALLKNPGIDGWNGPYTDPGSNFMDPYGKLPYFYHIKKTPKGNVYVEIFSMGLERPVGNIMAPKKEGGNP
ncbi:MAG: FecR domain-containing protein [Candidatus Omnitrophica bacterium]|nr:FecR domain-containing protein [Candidatus Omnitrophota bacterium]